MTKPYDQAFNIAGDTGVDLNIFLGGFHASWKNTDLPVTNESNKNIEANVNLFTSDSVASNNNIRVCGPVMIDNDTINLYNYANFDISNLFDSFKLLNPSISNPQIKTFQPGQTTFTNVFSHSKKTKITARLFNRPVIFEAWYSHNESSLETYKGYNSYTMFGKGGINSLPSVDLGTYPNAAIRVYVAGIFKLHADLSNPDISDIIAGVRYINKYDEENITLEIIVKGIVEKIITIDHRLTSINGVLDMSLEADIITLDTFKSNVARISVTANGITNNLENAVVIDQTSTPIEKKGLIDTYVVKQGFYIDTSTALSSIDVNTGLSEPIFNPNSLIEYQLVPMYTIPRATIRKPCKTCTFYISPFIDYTDPIILIPTTPSTTPTPEPTGSVTPTPSPSFIFKTDLTVSKVKSNKTIDITVNLSQLKPGKTYNSKLDVYFDTLTSYYDLIQIDTRDFVPVTDTFTYKLVYIIDDQIFIDNQTICVQSLINGAGHISSKTKCVPLNETAFDTDLTVSSIYKINGLTGDYCDYSLNMSSLIVDGRYNIELYGYFNYLFDNTSDMSDTYLISRFPYIATGETHLVNDRCLIDSMRTMEIAKGRTVETFCIFSRVSYTKQESNIWVEKYTSTDSECVPLLPVTTPTPTPTNSTTVFYTDLIVGKVKPNKTIDIIVKLFLLKSGEIYNSTLYVYFDTLFNFSDLIEIHTREFIPTGNSHTYQITYNIDDQRFINNESLCVHSISVGLGFTSVKTKCVQLNDLTTTITTPATTVTPTPTITPTPTTTLYLPADTFIAVRCLGFNKVEVYSDGEGGVYSEIVETNSIECGYIYTTPTPTPSILESIEITSFIAPVDFISADLAPGYDWSLVGGNGEDIILELDLSNLVRDTNRSFDIIPINTIDPTDEALIRSNRNYLSLDDISWYTVLGWGPDFGKNNSNTKIATIRYKLNSITLSDKIYLDITKSSEKITYDVPEWDHRMMLGDDYVGSSEYSYLIPQVTGTFVENFINGYKDLNSTYTNVISTNSPILRIPISHDTYRTDIVCSVNITTRIKLIDKVTGQEYISNPVTWIGKAYSESIPTTPPPAQPTDIATGFDFRAKGRFTWSTDEFYSTLFDNNDVDVNYFGPSYLYQNNQSITYDLSMIRDLYCVQYTNDTFSNLRIILNNTHCETPQGTLLTEMTVPYITYDGSTFDSGTGDTTYTGITIKAIVVFEIRVNDTCSQYMIVKSVTPTNIYIPSFTPINISNLDAMVTNIINA